MDKLLRSFAELWRENGDPETAAQLDDYLDRMELSTGALVVFGPYAQTVRRTSAPPSRSRPRRRGALPPCCAPDCRETRCLPTGALGVARVPCGSRKGSAARNHGSPVLTRQHRVSTWNPGGRGVSLLEHRMRRPGTACRPGRLRYGGWGRDRTGDLSLFRRSLVPTELPSHAVHRNELQAVLTGFEPAASTLTGWRALQTAPQDQICTRERIRICKVVRAPNGIRTRATALKGRRPGPLDDEG